MKTFALVENNIVVNLVIGDSAESFPDKEVILVQETAIPLVGWVYGVHGFEDPNPAPPPPVASLVPQSVSRFQARVALYQSGHLATIDAYMADPATSVIAKMAWQDAQEFRRQSPTVLSLAQLLGLTETQLDDLFIFASKVVA